MRQIVEDDAGFELDESDLFNDGVAKGTPPRPSLPGHGSDDEEHIGRGGMVSSEEEDVFDARSGEPGLNNSSAKSSTTLNPVPPGQGGVATADAESARHEWAAARGRTMPRYAPMPIAQSMPVHFGHVNMGSSVPINIPFLTGKPSAPGRGGAPTAGAPPPPLPPMPATFVPPHQLFSQRDDSMMSMMGESPSTTIKRDRLRHRNAVLKSTGFLEAGALPIPVPIVPITGTTPGDRPVGSAVKGAGGLSQALQMVGSPALL